MESEAVKLVHSIPSLNPHVSNLEFKDFCFYWVMGFSFYRGFLGDIDSYC